MSSASQTPATPDPYNYNGAPVIDTLSAKGALQPKKAGGKPGGKPGGKSGSKPSKGGNTPSTVAIKVSSELMHNVSTVHPLDPSKVKRIETLQDRMGNTILVAQITDGGRDRIQIVTRQSGKSSHGYQSYFITDPYETNHKSVVTFAVVQNQESGIYLSWVMRRSNFTGSTQGGYDCFWANFSDDVNALDLASVFKPGSTSVTVVDCGADFGPADLSVHIPYTNKPVKSPVVYAVGNDTHGFAIRDIRGSKVREIPWPAATLKPSPKPNFTWTTNPNAVCSGYLDGKDTLCLVYTNTGDPSSYGIKISSDNNNTLVSQTSDSSDALGLGKINCCTFGVRPTAQGGSRSTSPSRNSGKGNSSQPRVSSPSRGETISCDFYYGCEKGVIRGAAGKLLTIAGFPNSVQVVVQSQNGNVALFSRGSDSSLSYASGSLQAQSADVKWDPAIQVASNVTAIGNIRGDVIGAPKGGSCASFNSLVALMNKDGVYRYFRKLESPIWLKDYIVEPPTDPKAVVSGLNLKTAMYTTHVNFPNGTPGSQCYIQAAERVYAQVNGTTYSLNAVDKTAVALDTSNNLTIIQQGSGLDPPALCITGDSFTGHVVAFANMKMHRMLQQATKPGTSGLKGLKGLDGQHFFNQDASDSAVQAVMTHSNNMTTQILNCHPTTKQGTFGACYYDTPVGETFAVDGTLLPRNKTYKSDGTIVDVAAATPSAPAAPVAKASAGQIPAAKTAKSAQTPAIAATVTTAQIPVSQAPQVPAAQTAVPTFISQLNTQGIASLIASGHMTSAQAAQLTPAQIEAASANQAFTSLSILGDIGNVTGLPIPDVPIPNIPVPNIPVPPIPPIPIPTVTIPPIPIPSIPIPPIPNPIPDIVDPLTNVINNVGGAAVAFGGKVSEIAYDAKDAAFTFGNDAKLVINDIETGFNVVIKDAVGNAVINFTTTTYNEVSHGLETMYAAFNVGLDKLLGALGWMFDWKHIWGSFQVIKGMFSEYVDFVSNSLQEVAVNIAELVTSDFDKILGLSGTSNSASAAPTPEIDTNSPQGNYAAYHFLNNLTDAMESIESAVGSAIDSLTGSSSSQFNVPDPTDAVFNQVENCIGNLSPIVDAFSSLDEDTLTSFINQSPDDLKKLLGAIKGGPAQLIKDGIGALAAFTKTLPGKLKFEELNAVTVIPVVGPLISYAADLAGVGSSLTLSLSDVVLFVIGTTAASILHAVGEPWLDEVDFGSLGKPGGTTLLDSMRSTTRKPAQHQVAAGSIGGNTGNTSVNLSNNEFPVEPPPKDMDNPDRAVEWASSRTMGYFFVIYGISSGLCWLLKKIMTLEKNLYPKAMASIHFIFAEACCYFSAPFGGPSPYAKTFKDGYNAYILRWFLWSVNALYTSVDYILYTQARIQGLRIFDTAQIGQQDPNPKSIQFSGMMGVLVTLVGLVFSIPIHTLEQSWTLSIVDIPLRIFTVFWFLVKKPGSSLQSWSLYLYGVIGVWIFGLIGIGTAGLIRPDELNLSELFMVAIPYYGT